MNQITNNRIMIVGGDSHFTYLMQQFVRTSAHLIVMANLGDDVLAMAKDNKPVAIVLEVDPSEAVGWRTLQALKADSQAAKIPIIACSWLDEEARSHAEGADIYLRMPILYTDFSAALGNILAKEQNE